MLRLRSDQIESFGERRREGFRRELCDRLLEDHSHLAGDAGRPGVEAFVDRALAVLATWGIETEGAASLLVELMAQVGERFERSPDRSFALDTLAHPALPGAIKAQMVFEKLHATTEGRSVTLME